MPTCATFLRDARLVKNTKSPSRRLRRAILLLSFNWPSVLRDEAYAVGFLIELGYQAGAVRSMFAVATGTVGSAYPLGGIDVQFVVVCQSDIHT